MLGLKGGIAGRLGVDLNLDVGDVRDGINWEALKIKYAERGQAKGGEQHEPTVADGELEKFFEHGGWARDGLASYQWSWDAPDLPMSALMRKLFSVT